MQLVDVVRCALTEHRGIPYRLVQRPPTTTSKPSPHNSLSHSSTLRKFFTITTLQAPRRRSQPSTRRLQTFSSRTTPPSCNITMAPGIRYTNFSSHTWPLTWMYPEDCVTSSRHRKTLELNNYKYRVLFEEAAEFATRFFNQNLQHPTRRVIRLYLLESRILFGKRRALRAEVPPLGYERVSRALDMLVDNAMYHIKMGMF